MKASASNTVGRLVVAVAGGVAALLAVALLAAGGVVLWADSARRDTDGYFTTSAEPFRSSAYALVSKDLEIDADVPRWVLRSDRLGDVRLTASGDEPLFVGIARRSDLDAYLDGVPHDTVADVGFDPFAADYRREPGSASPSRPGFQEIWAASSEGAGARELDWKVEPGNWSVVVMNADGSRGVAADVRLGAKVAFLVPLGIVLLAVGSLFLVGGATMIFFGAGGSGPGRRRATRAVPSGSPAASAVIVDQPSRADPNGPRG